MPLKSTQSFVLAAVLGLLLAGTVAAQSPVAHISGQAVAGDTVLIENIDTGFHREVSVKGNGRYQLRNLPIGTFRVTVKHADGKIEPPKLVVLRVGATARVK